MYKVVIRSADGQRDYNGKLYADTAAAIPAAAEALRMFDRVYIIPANKGDYIIHVTMQG